MKKLLYIANLRLPTEKAYGIQIAKTCEAFALQGLGVELAHPFRDNHVKNNFFQYYSIRNNFKVKKIWAPDFYWPGRFDKFAANIKGVISALILCFYTFGQKADIIYSRDEWPLYFLSFFKNNLFFEAHRFSKSRRFFYARFKNKNFKIITITERLKDDFIKIGFKPENVLVAPDGVDLEEFNIDITKEEARIKIGLPLDKNIVMYTGHLFEWKGTHTLLEAAKLISNDQLLISKNILFVFVGGMEFDAEKFRRKIKDMNLKNVLILGHKLHRDIPFFLKAADVLVLPNSEKEEISKSYTSPLKLFEYMASKRPIVASDLPSIREILNETNSVLIKPDDSDALAGGVKKILNEPELVKNISNKAFRDVQNHSWLNRAKIIIDFSGLIE